MEPFLVLQQLSKACGLSEDDLNDDGGLLDELGLARPATITTEIPTIIFVANLINH